MRWKKLESAEKRLKVVEEENNGLQKNPLKHLKFKISSIQKVQDTNIKEEN